MKTLFTILLTVFSFLAHSQGIIMTSYRANKPTMVDSCTVLGITTAPTAAYSFRQLNPTCYTGQVVRIRRASDNAESDFGFASSFVDTAAIKTFLSTSDGFVVTWYDQSGSGYNVTQSTTTKQPKIATAGALIYADGHLATLFDGTDDILVCTIPNIISDYSFFAVSKRVSGLFVAITTAAAAGTSFTGVYNYNVTNQVRMNYNTTPFAQAVVGTANLNLNLSSGFAQSTTLTASDGTSTATGSITGSLIGLDRIGVGGIPRASPVYGAGYLSEAIYYASSQLSNRTTIEGNIKTRYGL